MDSEHHTFKAPTPSFSIHPTDVQPENPSNCNVAGGTNNVEAAETINGEGAENAQATGTINGEGAQNAQDAGTTDVQAVGTNRKLTSPVWSHFKKQKIDGIDKAICNYCGKKLSGKGRNGTTHLHDHYRKCAPRKNKDIRQSILNPRQEKKDGPVSLGAHTFDQNVSRTELAKMIVLHECPLNMVEHVGFRSFVNSVNPLFKHVSRTTIKSDIKDIFEYEKMKIKRILSANQGRIAVTTDMWTASNQKRGYMVVTAHYIDDSWNLCNKILRFMYVPAPHNAKTLAKALMGCLVSWSILEILWLENVLPRTGDFDILAWWKNNGLKYPTLQQVVKDVLAIPVSTVASESAFSTGGRHVTPHRNRLHPDLLETLICSQDWLWDEKIGTHSNREKHLAKFDVVKDDELGPSYVDFDT